MSAPPPATPRRAALLALLGLWLAAALGASPFTLRHAWLPAAPVSHHPGHGDAPSDDGSPGSGPHLLCFKCVLVSAAPQAPATVIPGSPLLPGLLAAPAALRAYPRLPRGTRARAPPERE